MTQQLTAPSNAVGGAGAVSPMKNGAIDGVIAVNGKGIGTVSCKWSHGPQCIPVYTLDGTGAVVVSCKRILKSVLPMCFNSVIRCIGG